MITNLLGYLSVGAALLLLGIASYRAADPVPPPLTFSPTQVLGATWYNYKNTYVEPETFRTVDKQRDGVTTSEGQSYTMLRAVWAGDQDTFDGAWRWTRVNLGRPSDNLFAWLWGVRADGTTGILRERGGQNTASDADTDIALALIFAYARWQDPSYLRAARLILDDLWAKEVIVIRGRPYLAANDLEKSSRSLWAVVNPSYFSPAAYRIFASADPTHDWEALRKNSYAVLLESMRSTLNASTTANLPPDWMQVNKSTGALISFPGPDDTSRFSFDALRIPLRVGLDWQWFGNPDAAAYLDELEFLSREWDQEKRLASTYTHDGRRAATDEVPAMYAGTLAHFMKASPETAAKIYRDKLLSLYDTGTGTWVTPLSYYDDNWAWFGIALYNGFLPNLAAELPPEAFSQSS